MDKASFICGWLTGRRIAGQRKQQTDAPVIDGTTYNLQKLSGNYTIKNEGSVTHSATFAPGEFPLEWQVENVNANMSNCDIGVQFLEFDQIKAGDAVDIKFRFPEVGLSFLPDAQWYAEFWLDDAEVENGARIFFYSKTQELTFKDDYWGGDYNIFSQASLEPIYSGSNIIGFHFCGVAAVALGVGSYDVGFSGLTPGETYSGYATCKHSSYDDLQVMFTT